MKVLFVSSGNSKNFNVTPFIKSQGDSLERIGVEVTYFTINGKGIFGYLKNIPLLRNFVRSNEIDLVHAHYSLTGLVVVLSFLRLPIILSLMGSDAYGTYNGKKAKLSSRYLTLITFLVQPFVDAIISKSKNIEKYVYMKKKSHIIPNGVDIIKFEKETHSKKTELTLNKDFVYVLFLGSPKNKRKNISLVEKSLKKLRDKHVKLLAPYPVPHDEIPKYLHAADVFVLASYMEGSPNVVKEAMVCNKPMVVTDVGDAAWVVNNTDGCYISEFSVDDYSKQLQKAIDFSKKYKKTNGRNMIIELGLDSSSTAKKIIKLYKKVLS